MPRRKLTPELIRRARYEGSGRSQYILWDAGDRLSVPGLGLRIFPSGEKAFVLSYRVAGRKHIMSLGSSRVLSVKQARSAAKKRLGVVEDGRDPLAEKRLQAARGKPLSVF